MIQVQVVIPKKQSVFLKQWQLQIMALSGIAFLLVFHYAPMFGVVLAFKGADYSVNIMKSLFEAPWIGFDLFKEFFSDDMFLDVLWNTIGLNLLQLCINFPAPVIFALLINELFGVKFKRMVQSISYFPHFVSWMVFGGIIAGMLSVETGVLNPILMALGVIQEPLHFLGTPEYFWWIIVTTSLLKGLGWGTIIYLAAIATIDPQMYEAATIDGIGRFRKIYYITLPTILGTIIVFLLLSISNLLNSSFDHIFVFQSPLNIERSEVIDTFVYKVGLVRARYSYTTAVGLFKSLVAMILLAGGHFASKRAVGRGLF